MFPIIIIILMALLLSAHVANSLILPGTGLVSTDTNNGNNAIQVLVFEHTALGTGGLVLNQPTPILLKDLGISRFQKFESHSLMLGCGSSNNDESNLNVAVGEMAPWFWIHTCSLIEKSFRLEGANGLLYMGGNLDQATSLIEQNKLDPLSFKFFYKYKKWDANELEGEIAEGKWIVGPQDAAEAIRPYSLPVFE